MSLLGKGWLLVPLIGLGAGLSLAFFPLELALLSFVPVYAAAALTAGLWLFYASRRPEPRLSALAESACFILAVMPLLAIFNYATTMADRPLYDAALAHLDQALGFDWMGHLAFIKSLPGVGDILTLVYGSSLVQFILAVTILALTGKFHNLRALVLLFAVTLAVTLILFAIFPAAGAYVYYAPGADKMVGFDPENGIWHLAAFTGLRDGTMTVLDLARTEGMVTFPSFHTALAVLTAWSLRQTRYVALPAAFLNGLVVLSTLSIGGHHLVDIIAGATIAMTAIAVYQWQGSLGQAEARQTATAG